MNKAFSEKFSNVSGVQAFLPLNEPCLLVSVTEVYSPGCFFVRNSAFTQQLNMLEKDLRAYVQNKRQNPVCGHLQYDIEIGSVMIGQEVEGGEGGGDCYRIKVIEDVDEGTEGEI